MAVALPSMMCSFWSLHRTSKESLWPRPPESHWNHWLKSKDFSRDKGSLEDGPRLDICLSSRDGGIYFCPGRLLLFLTSWDISGDSWRVKQEALVFRNVKMLSHNAVGYRLWTSPSSDSEQSMLCWRVSLRTSALGALHQQWEVNLLSVGKEKKKKKEK